MLSAIYPGNFVVQFKHDELRHVREGRSSLSFMRNFYSQLSELYKSGCFEEIIDKAGAILEIYDRNDTLLNFVGSALCEVDRGQLGLDKLFKSLKINPKNHLTLNLIGNAYKRDEKHDIAIDFYQKCLRIKPNFMPALNNYATALMARGQYDKALKYYVRVLAIDAKSPEILNNLGNLHKSKGNLQTATTYFKEALEGISLDNRALENLASLLVQSCASTQNENLEFMRSIIDNYHLTPKICTLALIKAFIDKDFNFAKQLSQYYGKFSKDSYNKMKREDQVFCSAYSLFIPKLISQTNYDTQGDTKYIYHFGESHCLSFAHQNFTLDSDQYRIKPEITFGTKAYHLAQSEENKFKALIKEKFLALKPKQKVFISFGEIDCRLDEGFILAHKKYSMPLNELVHTTVSRYVDWFTKLNDNACHELYFFTVPAPVFASNKENNHERLRVIQLFNSSLAEIIKSEGHHTINTYKLTSDHEGYSNGVYHIDKIHLSPTILKVLR